MQSLPSKRRHVGSISLAASLLAASTVCATCTASAQQAGAHVEAVGAEAVDAEAVELPPGWAVGMPLDGQRVVRIERHREFVRIHLEQGGFELSRCPDPTDAWCAGDLRLQPLPDQPADEAVLSRRLAELRADRPVGTRVFLRPVGAGAELDADGASVGWWLRRLLATANQWGLMYLLLVVSGFCFAGCATRDAPAARRGLVVLAVMAAAAPLLGRSLLGPASVRTEDIVLLHESSAYDAASLLVQRYAVDLPAWLLTNAEFGIHGIVAANRMLWVLGAAAIVVWMRALLASWWLAALVVGIAVTGKFELSVANSEIETPEIWLAICAGAAAFVVAGDARRSALLRWLAALYLPALMMVVDRRRETLLLIVAAVLALAVAELRRRPTWKRRLDAFAHKVAAVALHPATLLAFAVAVIVHGAFLVELLGVVARAEAALNPHVPSDGVVLSNWAGVVLAILPTDLSFVFAPFNLASWSNLLLAVLVACGAVAIWRERREWLWLLITVATVYKVYRHAGHAFPFEVVRYMSTLTPLWAMLAALGLNWAWPRVQARTPTPGARRLARLAVGLAALLDARYGTLDSSMGRWPDTGLLRGDQQASFSAMAWAVEQNPGCAIVTRSSRSVGHDGTILAEDIVVFGGAWREIAKVPESAALSGVLASLAPAPTCSLVFDSLDCRSIGSRGCAELAQGPVLRTFPASPIAYRHIHWGRPSVGLSAHWLRALRQDLVRSTF